MKLIFSLLMLPPFFTFCVANIMNNNTNKIIAPSRTGNYWYFYYNKC